MKYLFPFFTTLFLSAFAQAQTCTIEVYYDENGNRIRREEVCNFRNTNDPVDSMAGKRLAGQQAGADPVGPAAKALSAAGYKVYPNPSESVIHVFLDERSLKRPCSVSFADATGKTLWRREGVHEAVSTIDISPYSDGTYFVIVGIGRERNTVKVVKRSGMEVK